MLLIPQASSITKNIQLLRTKLSISPTSGNVSGQLLSNESFSKNCPHQEDYLELGHTMLQEHKWLADARFAKGLFLKGSAPKNTAEALLWLRLVQLLFLFSPIPFTPTHSIDPKGVT